MTDYGNGVKQRLKNFDDAHGDYVVSDGFIFYEDGAIRELNPYGCLIEPPVDVYQCAKLKLKFCELKLALATEEFSISKRNILLQTKANIQGQYAAAPTEAQKNTVKQLKSLKQKVESWKRKVRQAKTNLEKNKPQRLIERENNSENNRQANISLLSELGKIEI